MVRTCGTFKEGPARGLMSIFESRPLEEMRKRRFFDSIKCGIKQLLKACSLLSHYYCALRDPKRNASSLCQKVPVLQIPESTASVSFFGLRPRHFDPKTTLI